MLVINWLQLRRVERVCYLIGALLILSGLLHVGMFALEGGPLYGPVSWRKPITFGLIRHHPHHHHLGRVLPDNRS